MFAPQTLFIHFYLHVKVKPVRILFYRGGVSEGEFGHVLEKEVAAIRKVRCADWLQKAAEWKF